MDWLKAALLTGLLSVFFMNMAPEVFAADFGRGNNCRRSDRLTIEDLDVSPDPIVEGTRIRSWKVRVRFDGNRECETEISIREGGEVVAQGRRINLRPGVNEVDLRPSESYRFRGREHCFNVQVDLAWSMREGDDRARPFK
jgi:hypothetical protein